MFAATAPTHGHDGYLKAMREVATEEHVALIDLYSMSIAFYDAAVTDASNPAHPDSEAALNLGVLFSEGGGGRGVREGSIGAAPAGPPGPAPAENPPANA